MTQNESTQHEKIQEFVRELSGFAVTAENTLKEIESDLENKKNLLSVFSERMLAIRGTAQQLYLANIAHIAGLGEEISVKGASASSRSQVRRCVGSLWDALTTVKYLLEHYTEETNEEQKILVNRLENTLRILGGARKKVSGAEIEEMLRQRK
jgi:hypothetical protein